MRYANVVFGCVAVALFPFTACGPSATGGQCAAGHGDCDGNFDNGCETELSTIANCGACGSACNSSHGTASCDDGDCRIQCDSGFDDCDGDPANGCEQSLNDDRHCGACYADCGGANLVSGECVDFVCVGECAAGFADCNATLADGCESDLLTDHTCGSCESGCTGTCGPEPGKCSTCEEGVELISSDPVDAAKTIGICGGLLSARWTLPDGTNAPTDKPAWMKGHGNLPGFGTNVSPRSGSMLLALSSGAARGRPDPEFTQPQGTGLDKGYQSAHPPGFPKESPSCPAGTSPTGIPYDGIGLEVELQVPEWASGLAFDFSFYTAEWPTYVCTRWNDFFVAFLDPIPAGQTDGNISFDSLGNPVSVNNALVSVCGCSAGPPCLAGSKTYACEKGTTELEQTGFDDTGGGAATGWLTTKAPVPPGSVIKLRLAIYDSGDSAYDSTVLVDNFRWLAAPPEVGTEPIP